MDGEDTSFAQKDIYMYNIVGLEGIAGIWILISSFGAANISWKKGNNGKVGGDRYSYLWEMFPRKGIRKFFS